MIEFFKINFIDGFHFSNFGKFVININADFLLIIFLKANIEIRIVLKIGFKAFSFLVDEKA